jgi:hypothetical protein
MADNVANESSDNDADGIHYFWATVESVTRNFSDNETYEATSYCF